MRNKASPEDLEYCARLLSLLSDKEELAQHREKIQKGSNYLMSHALGLTAFNHEKDQDEQAIRDS